MRRINSTAWCLLMGGWLFSSCTSKEVNAVLEPSQALGKVLAEETMRAAGSKKRVALITHDASWGGASTVEEAFRETLRKQGFAVVTAKAAALGDPMRSGQVGLRAGDFFEAMEQSADAGAVVSLVGAPLVKPEEASRLPPAHPPVLVVATRRLGLKLGVPGDPVSLASLLEAKVIQMAIIDSADPAAPGAAKADAVHDLFAQHYRLLRRPD